MNIFFVGALALLVGTTASAQDHLWPDLSRMSAGVSHDNTDEIVATVFKEAFGDDVRLRALQTAAFAVPTEDIVFLKQKDDTYTVVYLHTNVLLVSYSSAIWMRDLRPDNLKPADFHYIRPTRCEAEIPKSLAVEIESVWREMLLETRYDRKPRLGMDGGWTEFSMDYNNRELAGRIWSPDDKTKPGMLVAVADSMQDFCSKPDKKSYSRLEQRVSDLQRSLTFDVTK